MNVDQLSKAKLRGTETSYVYGRDGTQHSYSHEERRSFVDYINYILRDDPDLKGVIPIDKESDQIFKEVRNGLLLCKFVNALFAGAIDESKLVRKHTTNKYEVLSNINLAIKGGSNIGCNLVNINAEDIYEGKPHIVLGFFWNIIRKSLLNKVSLDKHPELINILQQDEDISIITDNNPEKLLLRWFNFHLKNANHPRVVNNFKRDISDGENYLVLLEQIAPDKVPNSLHEEKDPIKRAELVCQTASQLDALKFISPEDILRGNEKLNLAFTAYLFHKYPGLDKDVQSRQEEIKELEKRRLQFEEEQRLKEEKLRDEERNFAEYQRLMDEENRLKLEKLKIESEQQQKLSEERDQQLKWREEQIKKYEESRKFRELEMKEQEDLQKMKEQQIRQMEEQQRMREENIRKMEEMQKLREEQLRQEEEEQMRKNERFSQEAMRSSYVQQESQFNQQQPMYSQYSQGSGGYYSQEQNMYSQYQHSATNQYQDNPMFTSNIRSVVPPSQSSMYTSLPFNTTYMHTLPVEPPPPPPIPQSMLAQSLLLQQPSVPTYTVTTFTSPPPPPPPPRRVVVTTTTTTIRKRI